MRIASVLTGLAALSLPVTEAAAQLVGTFRLRPGLGAKIQPEYPGAQSHEWAAYPTFSIARDDRPFGFGAADDSFGISLLSQGKFSAGPALAIEGSRKESEVGALVGTVGTTVEAGAFAQVYATDSLRLRTELRRGIGGHDGWVGHAAADQIWRDGDRYLFSIGPRLVFSDARYQRAYFGVTPQASLASGLPVHRPSGGLHAVAVSSSMNLAVGGGWGLFGFARYERLVGDARRSPIVRELGSPNQVSAGIGVSRTFTIRL